ncbi:MAG: F0F1 ATP synthase subunit alpha, partial [Agrococcus sp.]
QVLQFESELLEHMRHNGTVLATLRETNVLDDATLATLEAEVDAFVKNWQGKPSSSITDPGTESAEPMVEDVNQEQIVKGRR